MPLAFNKKVFDASSALRCAAVFVLLLLTATMPRSAAALSAAFTEIMYDLPGADAGREWLEVQNVGGEAWSLSSFKLFEGDTNHALALARGEATTSPGGFAVIAADASKFLLDWPAFSGTLFDSSFSLSNSGEPLSLKFANAVLDAVTYSSSLGAAGDGNSLQNSGGVWQARAPTPGAAPQSSGPAAGGAQSSTTAPVSSGENAPQTSSADSGRSVAVSPLESHLAVSAHIPRTAIVGGLAEFSASATGAKNEPLQRARFVWSFGDGATAEGERVLHTYHYPAAYVVLVEVSSGGWSAGSRGDITVSAPLLSIPRIEAGAGGFIEVRNGGSQDVELAGFALESGSSSFVFPGGTILPAGRGIPFPNEVTKLSADSGDIVLLFPNRTRAAAYVPPRAAPFVSPTFAAQAPASSSAPFKTLSSPVRKTRPAATAAASLVSSGPADSGVSSGGAGTQTASATLAAAVLSDVGPSPVWPWALGAAALVGAAVAAFLYAARAQVTAPASTPAEAIKRAAGEYDIIE